MINLDLKLSSQYKNAKPFNYIVIDNFLDLDFASELENSFFEYNSDKWHTYSNSIEEKKTCNIWNEFNGPLYKYFSDINSSQFVELLSKFVGEDLEADPGLHGGGLHIHSSGGNLNPHLDYSIHPKLNLQRKINIIYYCSNDKALAESKTGFLGLWEGDSKHPYRLVKEIEPKFNRLVIFDTTQNSWHGLVNPIPEGMNILRKSLASYYLCKPAKGCEQRTRAKFAPRDEQKEDKKVLDTIDKRSSEHSYSDVYIVKDE
jgi:Rps23 Pro-64 3,4-dihydroxylase Tpa1-like proline 4-hydroxylase